MVSSHLGSSSGRPFDDSPEGTQTHPAEEYLHLWQQLREYFGGFGGLQ